MLNDVEDLDMPAVEREITTLAGHLAAGTCRFLQLVATFDTGGGWHGHGLRSCTQWLSWRCGLSTTAAREHLRVAHALTGLPAVRAAFGAGEISFSKARALTRVATPESEADLLDVATGCTAGQLDRLCAGLGRARRNNEVLDRATQATFTARWEPDGTLRFSGRLAPEDGAVLLAALAALREPAITDPPAGPTADADDPPGPADGLPGDRYRDAAAFAARDDAAALVALARHALTNPPLEVGTAPVRLIVHTTDQALAAPTDPASAEAGSVGVLDAGPGVPLLPLGPDTLRRLACEALVEPASHPDHDQTPRAQQRFATTRQRRALLRRDGGCVFAGCGRRRHLHAHHVVPWSEGGPTSMRNLALICQHHHLLIHEGGWQLHPRPDSAGRPGWIAVGPGGQHHRPAPATAGAADRLPTTHPAHIEPGTVTGHWHGEPLHLDYAISVLS